MESASEFNMKYWSHSTVCITAVSESLFCLHMFLSCLTLTSLWWCVFSGDMHLLILSFLFMLIGYFSGVSRMLLCKELGTMSHPLILVKDSLSYGKWANKGVQIWLFICNKERKKQAVRIKPNQTASNLFSGKSFKRNCVSIWHSVSVLSRSSASLLFRNLLLSLCNFVPVSNQFCAWH